MIKAIIFDLGGVIIKHSGALSEEIVSEMFDSSQEALEILKEHRINLSKGAITSEEFLTLLKINQNSKLSIDELQKQWRALYEKGAKNIDWDLIKFIEELKKKYSIYLFTDTIALHDQFNRTRGIYERFHRVFKSYVEKVSKKEGKEAFTHVLGKIKEKPKECIFIDDKKGNVENAEKAGIHGIVYKNFQELKTDLDTLGVDAK